MRVFQSSVVFFNPYIGRTQTVAAKSNVVSMQTNLYSLHDEIFMAKVTRAFSARVLKLHSKLDLIFTMCKVILFMSTEPSTRRDVTAFTEIMELCGLSTCILTCLILLLEIEKQNFSANSNQKTNALCLQQYYSV